MHDGQAMTGRLAIVLPSADGRGIELMLVLVLLLLCCAVLC